ncbi:MAG: Bax inhibitor-1 family protein [Alphaproteobacteria bacterium]|nr:Bax inhibitor-1 family protein [Alphaproteobacteria bacterium]
MDTAVAEIQDSRPLPPRSVFLARVYLLLVFTLIVAAGGTWYGILVKQTADWYPLMGVIFIALSIGLAFVSQRPVLNYAALFTFSGFGGYMFSPAARYIAEAGQAQLLALSFLLTLMIFTVLSITVLFSKRDFEFLRTFTFAGLALLICAGVYGIFVPLDMNWTAFHLLGISGAVAYILYQTSEIVRRYPTDAHVAAVAALYLDVFKLFIHLLGMIRRDGHFNRASGQWDDERRG